MANIYLPGRTTLDQIRYQARARADMLINGAPIPPQYPDAYRDSFITSEEANTYINQAWGELYELLTIQYSNYWNVATALIQADGTNEQFPLPMDLFKHLSTEAILSPSIVNGVNTNNTNNITLKRFNLQERNAYSNATFAMPVNYQSAIRYSVFGNNLWFKPRPDGGQYFQVLYVPNPLPLKDTGSITMNSVVAADTLTISYVQGTSAAVSTTLTAIAFGGTPGATEFVVGGTGATNTGDTGTAESLASVLNATFGGAAGFLEATAAYGVVHLVLTAPVVITWSALNSHLVLDPNEGTGADGLTLTWSNTMTAYTGLEEYLIVDTAIRMMQKEEADCGVLMAQKQALIKRYETNYTNRDPGNPKTSTRTRIGWGGRGGPGGSWGGGY